MFTARDKKASHCRNSPLLIVTCAAWGFYIPRELLFSGSFIPWMLLEPLTSILGPSCCSLSSGAPVWSALVHMALWGCSMHGEKFQAPPNQRASGMSWAERCSELENFLPPCRWGKRLREERGLAKVPQEICGRAVPEPQVS